MLAIIDYGAGNIGSVQRACAETGIQSVITANPGDLKNAERIIFPGVGAAPAAMENLNADRTGCGFKRSLCMRGFRFLVSVSAHRSFLIVLKRETPLAWVSSPVKQSF